ncbi:hypothetical protein [Thiorhodococcus minor]|uniref:Uncharacterized protein n=1 Tax=Thiorhodococcus minor TaxID=57489 RepID=A0A6M0K7Z6_9GAMM|nr:hypothetical protein [Thiorhodococcus minor]NEV64787.1 hypothetical protein [Thiorhodococcus minor]
MLRRHQPKRSIAIGGVESREAVETLFAAAERGVGPGQRHTLACLRPIFRANLLISASMFGDILEALLVQFFLIACFLDRVIA